MYTVQRLKNQITGAIRSADINKTHSFESALDLAKIELLSLIQPISLVSESEIEGGVFSGETRFELPENVNEDYVIGIRRCTPSCCCDLWKRAEDWDMECHKYKKYNISYINGVKYLQLDLDATGCGCTAGTENKCMLDFSSLTSNGYWNTYGGVSDTNIKTIENTDFLTFNLNKAGSIKNSTAVVPDFDLDKPIYVKLYIDKPHMLSTVSVKIGAGNNVALSSTTKSANGSFKKGINLLKFDDFNVTGTPESNAWEISFGLTNIEDCDTCNDVKIGVGCISQNSGECFYIKYMSKAIFQNPATGEFIDYMDNSNEKFKWKINLDEEAYLILYHLTAEYLKQNVFDENTQVDSNRHRAIINNLVAKYNKKHRSLVQNPSATILSGMFTPYSKLRGC